MMETAAPAPEPRKLRRWPVGILVGFLTAIVGAFAVAPVADWVMAQHHVSTMEGGRACAVVGLWMPATAIVAFFLGLLVTVLVRRDGFIGYLLPQGLALVLIALVIAAAAGIGYATADHPPLLNGKSLALEIEVQLPAKGRSIDDFKNAGLGVALVVSESDRNYSDLRWVDALESNESFYISAWAPLRSSNAGRIITVDTQGESAQIFDVNLPAAPKATTDEWTEWQAPRARLDGSKPAPDDQYLVRYRVRFADEYSPTPPPDYSPPTSETDEPLNEESPAPFPRDEAGMPQSDALDRGLLPSPAETPR